MEFQIAEAVELIKTLAETENLTLNDALVTFVAEAELDTEYASQLKGVLFERYSLKEMAEDALTKALFNVFVSDGEDLQEVDTKETADGTKYKVRVSDRESGSSYVRYATREKIAELRANPNIASVELTDYGSTGEDDRGQRTAAAKGGGAGRDYDGDGKKESSSKEHAGVVHNAIQRKMGGRPDGQDTRREGVEMEEGLSQMGGMARETGAKGGRDVLPWNKSAKYNTKGELRKPGTNVHGEKIKSPTTPKSTSGMGVKEDYVDEMSRAKFDAMSGQNTAASRGGETSTINKRQQTQRTSANAAGARGPEFVKPAKMRQLKSTMPQNMRNGYEPEGGEEISEGGMHRDAKTGEVVDKAEVGKTYYPNMPKRKSSVAKRKEEEKKKLKEEGMHRDAKTGEVVDKAEVGKTYYPNMPKRKTSVAKRKEAEKKTRKESAWEAYLALREEAKKKLDEEVVVEADLMDAGRKNKSERTEPGSAAKPPQIKGTGVDNSTVVQLMPKISEAVVTEKAESKSQQRLMGMVRAAQKGELEDSSEKVKELAKKMGKDDVKDFAKTKHDGLPEKKEEEEQKESVKLDEFGMPISEMSTNNARPGPSKEMIDPPADPNGDVGHMNPKGKPKRYKEKGEAPGDRRPNSGGPDLPNESGTVPNGAGT